ncbi:hypothetical protein ACHAXH_009551 [Discostella pseudostelligera]
MTTTSSSSLRYVPQGPASLSSDAPGWSSASNDSNKDVSMGMGPVCWKCRGRQFLSVAAAGKSKRRVGEQQCLDADTTVPPDNNNNMHTDQLRQRSCPVCTGLGHLPIKSKYLQSMIEPSGAITSRRLGRTSRQNNGWVEFGHIPGAVRAALHLLSNSSMNDDDDVASYDAATKYDDDDMMRYAVTLLSHASRLNDDNGDKSNNIKRQDIPVNATIAQSWQGTPKWLPTNPGEQLCNLTGYWRILQRKGSHRWTTDDVVTAYVAASTFLSSCIREHNENNTIIDEDGESSTPLIRYLDLGTGNASVLQMVIWYLLSSSSSSSTSRGCKRINQSRLEAVGVEARSEAVILARRSLSFNLGEVKFENTMYCGGVDGDGENDDGGEALVDSTDPNVQIVQGDFRDLISLAAASLTKKLEFNEHADGPCSMEDVASKRYDLITGTPPYFRVGFTTSKTQGKRVKVTTETDTQNDDDNEFNNDYEVVTAAVIEQGGMPTSMQSAPARCEFRGGIEAYCLAASALLSEPHGIFVVCENWENDDRVWKGAAEAGLIIECVWPVGGGGKQRQGHILFAVYVMRKIKDQAQADEDCKRDVEEMLSKRKVIRPTLVVRDENGKWTEDYAKVMNAMSIPAD